MRLIDADELIYRLREIVREMQYEDVNDEETAISAYLHSILRVKCMPTIYQDGDRIRHGHWTETHLITLDKNGDFIMSSEKSIRCSECLRTFDMEKLWARKFCPGCGTKMDEEIHNETKE